MATKSSSNKGAKPKTAAKKPAKAKAAAEEKPQKPVDEKAAGKKASSSAGPLVGVAHNLTKVKQLIKPYYGRYKRLMDDQASENGRFSADKRVLFEDAAGDLGTKRRLVSKALKEMYTFEKQQEEEKKMDRDELSQLDTMRDALGLFGETDLGKAAIASVSKPKGANVTSLRDEPDDEDEDETESRRVPEPEAA